MGIIKGTNEVVEQDAITNISEIYDEAIKFQVREGLETLRKGRPWGDYLYNRSKIVEKTDFDTCVSIRKMQIELLGSTKLYEMIDRNLKELKSNPLFVKEELKLYEWRSNFFFRHFPHKTWTTGYPNSDPLPVMFTKYFDEIAAHIGCKFKKDELRIHGDDRDYRDIDADRIAEKDKLLLEVCEDDEEEISFLFDKGLIEVYAEDGAYFEYSIREHNLTIERSLHTLVAMYPGKPLTLEYYALKKVLELGIPISELPTKAMRVQATKGFLSTKEDAEEYLNSDGKQYLEWNCE